MSKRRSHLIERHVFELTATASKGAFEWERNASRMQERIIGPAVEECFREFPVHDRHLIIERLEVDLGTLSPDRFEVEAGHRLMGALRDQLRTLYRDSERRSAEISHGGPGGYRSHESQEAEVLLLAGDSRADYLAFVAFLQRGRLPWWYESRDLALLPQDQFTVDWIRSLSLSERADLKELLRANVDARIRLTTQFSGEWIAELLGHIGLFGEEGLRTWDILHRLFQTLPRLRPRVQQSFWTAWMATASHPEACPDVSSVLEEAARGDRALTEKLLRSLWEICLEESAGSAASSPAKEILRQLQTERHGWDTSGAYASRPKPNPHDEEASRPEVSEVARSRPEHDWAGGTMPASLQNMESAAPRRTRPSSAKEEEAVFVHSAGLVLLHPFLPELFTQTNLWDGKAWRTEQAAFRAASLLSYLASGQEGVAEYRLLLHKLLSGIDLEAALPAEASLESQEIDACEELLRAVVGHWKAIGKTSSDGLREGFIERQGKLKSIDNGYQLQVERKAQDVLLSHLPWGYSLVKLPWMKSMLHINWI